MIPKLISLVLDITYGTFIIFFYTYIAMTFIHVNPFSLGFHPPTDLAFLSFILVVVATSTTFIKSLGLISDMVNAELAQTRSKTYYIPTQRN